MSNPTQNEPQRQRLGRGLAALLGETASDTTIIQQSKSQRRLALEHIRPNPANPRKVFSEEDLQELADSIKKRGVLQPILVRQLPGTTEFYEIIAGERRWRAAQKAGVFDVPVSVIEATDRQALEIAIIENVQRADLNALEEASGYQKLCVDFGYSHGDLAQEIGKSRSHVANTLRLLNLPEAVHQYLISGTITAGHARAMLTAPDPAKLAKRAVDEHLSVRDVERLARETMESTVTSGQKPQTGTRSTKSADADTKDIIKALTDALGMTISIQPRGNGGILSIRYLTYEQLERLQLRLSGA